MVCLACKERKHINLDVEQLGRGHLILKGAQRTEYTALDFYRCLQVKLCLPASAQEADPGPLRHQQQRGTGVCSVGALLLQGVANCYKHKEKR